MRKKKEQAIITHVAAHDIFGQFRYFKNDDDGGIWFVGVDVAKILGYKNSRDALEKHVDEEDKNTVANATVFLEIRTKSLSTKADFTRLFSVPSCPKRENLNAG